MHYRVGLVWEEAQMVVERLNGFHATNATLIQQAVGSLLSKEAGKNFKKTVESLIKNGE